jgi:hypothetical protein
MSVAEILSGATARVVAGPHVEAGTGSAGTAAHAYAVRNSETGAWAVLVASNGTGGFRWTVRLEDSTVFRGRADARLAAQKWFPLDRTEVVRVNLPLRSPSGGEGYGGLRSALGSAVSSNGDN